MDRYEIDRYRSLLVVLKKSLQTKLDVDQVKGERQAA